MRKILAILSTLLLSIGAIAQTGQVNHGGTGLNASANNSILVGTGPNTYVLVNVPDCQDANGNHLNYTAGSYTVTCGTSSVVGSGTPYQVTRYDSTGHALQDSTGSDNPANGPTRWANGLSVEGNAGYRLFSNSPAGTSVNLLACADASVTTVTQVTTCAASSNKTFGIVDNGAGVSGNARVAMIGFHSCVFDNQTAVNDYVAPSTTLDGQCSDVGGSKPNNVQIIGKVTTVNSGAGTLATVDLFTGDTVAPGSSGGSGTVSSSCTGVTYYPSPGTTVVGDCLFLTDGAGHITMYSLGILDSTYAGFLYMKQGPLPPAAPDNTIEEFAPTSVTTYSIQKASVAGAAGECWQVTGTATDANGHTIDQMGWGSCSGGGGGGSVTNFTAGNLSPLFTSSVANPTTVPALTFSLSNAAANTIFGNFTGSSGAPSYNAISACGDSTHALSYVASTGFSCQAISSGASSVGLSINGGSSSGIFAITGSPVTSSGTLNTNTAGTSGGVPYFSTSAILSSSAQLSSNNPVIGGGAGGPPASGARSGNTTTFGTTSGSLTSGNCLKADASGNIVDSGGTCTTGATTNCTTTGNAGECALYPNDFLDGTTVLKAARFKDNTTNQQSIRKFMAGDPVGWASGIIGIVQSGAGTTGSAEICYRGRCNCQFSSGNTPTAGLLVQIDGTAGEEGKCSADGAAGLNEDPHAHNFFARVHTTAGAGATTDIDMLPVMSFDGSPAAASTIYPGVIPSIAPGGQFFNVSPMALETASGQATAASPFVSNTTGFRLRSKSNVNQFFDIYSEYGSSGGDDSQMWFEISNVGTGGGAVFCSSCSSATPGSAAFWSPAYTANVSGGVILADEVGNSLNLTLTGNTTLTIQRTHVGKHTDWHVCQDGAGGHTLTVQGNSGGGFDVPPTIATAANACTNFSTVSYGTRATPNLVVTGVPSSNTGILYKNDSTAQTAAVTDTTMYTPGAAGVYRFTGTINCTTTSAAATATLNLKYTDTGNTAQTVSVTDTCTALVTTGIPQMVTAIRSKSGTAITWGVTIANTPTYDVSVRLEAM